MKDPIFDKAKAMAMGQIPDLQAAQARAVGLSLSTTYFRS